MACTNGGRPKPGTPSRAWVNPNLYLSAPSSVPGIPSAWQNYLLGLQLASYFVDATNFCANQPPFPSLPQDLTDIKDLTEYSIRLAEFYAWNQICECKPPTTSEPRCAGKNPGWYGIFNYVGLPNGPAVDPIIGSTSPNDTITFVTNAADPAGCRRVLVNGVYFGQKPCPPPGQQLTECRAVYCSGGSNVDQPNQPPASLGTIGAGINPPASSIPPLGDIDGGLPLPTPAPEEQPADPNSPADCSGDLDWVYAGEFSQGARLAVDGRKICRALVTITQWNANRGRQLGSGEYPDRKYSVGWAAFQYGSGMGETQLLEYDRTTLVAVSPADVFSIRPDVAVVLEVRLGLLRV